MTELSERDPRVWLSKSFMTGADMCGERAWRDIHDPRPFVMTEKVAFGKAVDVAVGHLIATSSAPDPAVATDYGMALIKDDARFVDRLEVERAAEAFVTEVLPAFDWDGALLQHHVRIDIHPIGGIDGHPDIILADGTILDVKTASKAKPLSAAADSVLELGFYALARYYETGVMPPRVGYVTWVRSSRPYWQIVTTNVTDNLLDRAAYRASVIRGAIEADTAHNLDREEPRNVSFPNGPKYAGLCNTCAHAPRNGGACSIAEE